MLMNELLEEGLFRILSESPQVANKEMQNAYECFMKQIKEVNQSEQNYTETFRILNFTRIEFKSLQTFPQYKQGGKCL